MRPARRPSTVLCETEASDVWEGEASSRQSYGNVTATSRRTGRVELDWRESSGYPRTIMLKSVDVLIGLVVVLLALSMAVTVITQTVTSILNSRGRHLRRGLIDLLTLVDPTLPENLSKKIATAVLEHPLVSGSSAFGVTRLGNVVHREEFTKLLLGLADGNAGVTIDGAARDALKNALAANGVDNPDAVLKAIRTEALTLEKVQPDLASSVRQNLAILKATESDFVAKVHNWFDQSIDRTAQRFTASTRVVTFAGGLIVALALQVNTLSLANRLAADDKLREAFVSQAAKMQPPAGPQNAQPDDADKNQQMEQQYRAFLAENGILKFPNSLDEWERGLTSTNLAGILITALLLSLGAPFWYNMLGQLLQLRSVLAFKDDAQRKERQDNTLGASSTPS